MNRIAALYHLPDVSAACRSISGQLDTILEQIIRIQQVPAPTFAEKARAEYMMARFRDLCLADISCDDVDNVYGRLPGTNPSGLPPVIVSAHLDTVFPQETDLTVRRESGRLYGPGIGDNSTGLAGLLVLADLINQFGLRPPADIWFVANSGEEGLGDLRGIRAVVDRFGDATYVVVEGGLYGQLAHQGIGVRRYCIEVTGPGGHSWGDFGRESAIHVLGSLIMAIDNLDVPEYPKTTFNVGLIEGGHSINSIASSARLWLDLRSEDPKQLQHLNSKVQTIIRKMSAQHAEMGSGIKFTVDTVGDRPAGTIPQDTPVVAFADEALRVVGWEEPHYIIGSTDANIPLSRGYPAVCLGLTISGNSHRVDEYIETSHLPAGLAQLLLVALAAAGYEGA